MTTQGRSVTPGTRPAQPAGRRRIAPSFAVSALAHVLLLALAILLARHAAEPPEWLPAPAFDMVFEGGKAGKPSVAAPEPRKPSATPEPAPTSSPAPPPVPPPRPAAPAAVPPPPAAAAVEPLPMPPPRPAPVPSRPAPARPAFPMPTTFSLGGPAVSPSERRRAGRGIDLSLGQGVLGAKDTRIFGRSDSKQVGPDWYNRFTAWWDRHSYYPPQAGENGQEGEVVLDLVVLRSGRVASVVLVSGSGSQWLDMAALGVMRGAKLPPLPSDAAPSVPIRLDIHYNIIR